MHATRLPLRTRVRVTLFVAVNPIAVVGAWAGLLYIQMPPALLIRAMHGQRGVLHTHCNLFRQRSPNLKALHSYSASRVNSATGKRFKSVCTRTWPPIVRSRVKRFLHCPGGSVTVVPAQ